MNSSYFQFKQFAVDQTHCAMKVNTDGVLLGAWANAEYPQSILDIGTGTGVIALMLAQRFPNANIDAVEIDKLAATTAAVNFQASDFASRLKAFPLAIEHYWMVYPNKQFDLIVTNPPFFIDDLKSEEKGREIARHTDQSFFENVLKSVSLSLSKNGRFWLILPLTTSEIVQKLAKSVNLNLQEIVQVKSFEHSTAHRHLLSFGFQEMEISIKELIIYESEKVYHPQYRELLQNFLTIF